MYLAILFSGLELPSYLGEKSSIVITEIWSQRALAKAKILVEVSQITSTYSCVCEVLRQGGPGHHLELKQALQVGEFENQTPSSTDV